MQSEKKNSVIDKQIVIESPRVLPGSLWGVASFFNPVPYVSKLNNYMKFRAAAKKQGLKLLTVELGFGRRPFQLTDKDADLLIQLRSDEVLWQKETLLNIGMERLPQDCDKVVWLDADVIFTDENWIKKTADMLQRYKVLQLFKRAHFLNKKGDIDFSAYGGLFCHFTKEYYTYSCPGLAWGARRETIQKCRLYDAMVFGGGDVMFMHGLLNEVPEWFDFDGNSILPYYKERSKKLFDETRGSFYYLDTEISHLYHGKVVDRRYRLRESWYINFQFDPHNDIERVDNGCWKLKNFRIKKLAKKYFLLRNEDESLFLSFIYNIQIFFISTMSYFFSEGKKLKRLLWRQQRIL